MSEDRKNDDRRRDDRAREREKEGGVRELVDRAIEWLSDVLAPAPVPVPVRVPASGGRAPKRRR